MQAAPWVAPAGEPTAEEQASKLFGSLAERSKATSLGRAELERPSEASFHRWPEANAPRRRTKTPYLDALTIKTDHHPRLQHLSAAGGGEFLGTHSRLLEQPALVPDLEHTGVRANLRQAYPLFYPDGSKSMAVGNMIQEQLRMSLRRQPETTAAPRSSSRSSRTTTPRVRRASRPQPTLRSSIHERPGTAVSAASTQQQRLNSPENVDLIRTIRTSSSRMQLKLSKLPSPLEAFPSPEDPAAATSPIRVRP